MRGIFQRNVFNITINIPATEITEDIIVFLTEKFQQIMAKISELQAQVDELQVALDTEQQQIADALAELNATIEELRAIVADGGTEAERQALADKLTAITADLQGTIPETPTEPTT